MTGRWDALAVIVEVRQHQQVLVRFDEGLESVRNRSHVRLDVAGTRGPGSEAAQDDGASGGDGAGAGNEPAADGGQERRRGDRRRRRPDRLGIEAEP